MVGLVLLIVVGTSIWVLFDEGEASWKWFFGCLALWIVVFPLYLATRARSRFQGYQRQAVDSVPERATKA